MQFTHEVTATHASPSEAVWEDWASIHALPRFMSHVRAVAAGEGEDTARLVILLDGSYVEFAVERTMCASQTLCWQSLGETFLYVLSLRLETASERETEIILSVAYDPPGFLPDIAESLGRGRKFKQTLEADLQRYAAVAQGWWVGGKQFTLTQLFSQPRRGYLRIARPFKAGFV